MAKNARRSLAKLSQRQGSYEQLNYPEMVRDKSRPKGSRAKTNMQDKGLHYIRPGSQNRKK